MPKRSRTPPTYDQRVQHITIDSAALGVKKSFYIYVPPELKNGQRAQAVYMLRGHEREWINPTEDATRGGTNAIDVYQRLRSAGRIGPLVLVFPGLSSDDNSVPSVLMNMRAPELADHVAGIGRGQFADYFYNELVPYIDTFFPSDGGRRGMIGFSLGGAMAAKAAAERPDLFASAAAFDGTFLYAQDNGRSVKRADGVIANPMFNAAFGQPRDFAHLAANSPANLVLNGDAAKLASVTWLISFGPREIEPWGSNYFRGMHLLRCLRARGIANAIDPAAIADRAHSWNTADAFLELVLPIIAGARKEATANPGAKAPG
ncbi:MAG: esterase [Chloroflexales bacterium]|nr:esterase [Chloroflexales bacterium]